MPGPRMDVAKVRRLARDQRVVAHPVKYHAGKHGLGFQDCVAALEHCHSVHTDDRPGHPEGWYALAAYTHGRTLRVDFDAHQDEDGDLILVVTAYRM